MLFGYIEMWAIKIGHREGPDGPLHGVDVRLDVCDRAKKAVLHTKHVPIMLIISGHILCVNPRFGSIPVIEAHVTPHRGPSRSSRWSILIAHITIYQKNISLKIIGLNEWTLNKYAPKIAKIAISKPFYAIFAIMGAILCVKPLFWHDRRRRSACPHHVEVCLCLPDGEFWSLTSQCTQKTSLKKC